MFKIQDIIPIQLENKNATYIQSTGALIRQVVKSCVIAKEGGLWLHSVIPSEVLKLWSGIQRGGGGGSDMLRKLPHLKIFNLLPEGVSVSLLVGICGETATWWQQPSGSASVKMAKTSTALTSEITLRMLTRRWGGGREGGCWESVQWWMFVHNLPLAQKQRVVTVETDNNAQKSSRKQKKYNKWRNK